MLNLIRPLPESTYSLRIFPGSLTGVEYCMDFVGSTTGAPAHRPFAHSLWAVPGPDVPGWGGMPLTTVQMHMRTIETMFGVKPRELRPGHD